MAELTAKLTSLIVVTAVAVTAVYMKGFYDGGNGKELAFTNEAEAVHERNTPPPAMAVMDSLAARTHA